MDTSLETIKKRLAENAYFINPHSDVNVQSDITWLIGELDRKEAEIGKLKKKAELLAHQVMELTQEMENIKSDFGGQR
jgi:hypothetical protein